MSNPMQADWRQDRNGDWVAPDGRVACYMRTDRRGFATYNVHDSAGRLIGQGGISGLDGKVIV